MLKRFGQVEGIEADADLVESCDHPDGYIHVGWFDESFQPGKTYRLIVMLDVLEHLPDAAGRAAARVLAVGPRRDAVDHRPRLPPAVDHARRPESALHAVHGGRAFRNWRDAAACESTSCDIFTTGCSRSKMAVRLKEACLPLAAPAPATARRPGEPAAVRHLAAGTAVVRRARLCPSAVPCWPSAGVVAPPPALAASRTLPAAGELIGV